MNLCRTISVKKPFTFPCIFLRLSGLMPNPKYAPAASAAKATAINT